MKRIPILTLLLAAAICCKAQSTIVGFDELPEVLSNPDLLGNYLISNSSEQRHDDLDSLYYLNTKTYALPYSSKKDKEFVKQKIAAIVNSYDRDIQSHTGGYCSTSDLDIDANMTTSRKVVMYCGDCPPLIVGGEGRNYAILRMRDKQNPIYRSIVGMEWWREKENKKKDIVKLQTFKLYGPQSDMRANTSNSTGVVGLSLQTKEDLLAGIKNLAQIYKHDGNPMDRPIATSINERIKAYNSISNPLTHSDEDELKLYRALDKIPGYYVYIMFDDGKNMTCSFGAYANIYPKLDIFCTSFYEFADIADEGTDFTTGSINYLYQVYVNNKATDIFPDMTNANLHESKENGNK